MDTIENERGLLMLGMSMSNVSTNIQKFGTGIFANLGSDQILEKLRGFL